MKRIPSQKIHGPTRVIFERSSLDLCWTPADGTLLDLAERHGLHPPWSCRRGVCNSCLTRLVEGEVEHPEDLLLPPAGDEVLLCCARPKTRRVVVEA